MKTIFSSAAIGNLTVILAAAVAGSAFAAAPVDEEAAKVAVF